MRRTFFFIALIALFVLSACQIGSSDVSSTTPDSTSSVEVGDTIIVHRDNAIHEKSSDLFLNFDDLGKYLVVSGDGGSNYTETDLINLAQDETQKDYATVVKNYVKQELKEEVSALSSVNSTYNPRQIIAVTTVGNIYSLTLKKWYDHDGIWTVSSYAKHGPDSITVEPYQSQTYELIETEDIKDSTLKKEVTEKINAKSEGHYHYYSDVDQSLYILLVAGKDKAVELLDVLGNGGLMKIEYTFISNFDQHFGNNPYILIKKDDSSIVDLIIKKYSGVEIDDIRLNMP